MFEELEKYKKKNHFVLGLDDKLQEVCNAPDKPGVYLVYALVKGKTDLVYIGYTKAEAISGRPDRRTGRKRLSTVIVNTLNEEITKAPHFEEQPRYLSWPKQIKKEKIEALDVYWYVTLDKNNRDLPEDVERILMQQYIHSHGKLPKWNTVE